MLHFKHWHNLNTISSIVYQEYHWKCDYLQIFTIFLILVGYRMHFVCVRIFTRFFFAVFIWREKNEQHFSKPFFIISNAFGVEMNERIDGRKKNLLYFVNVPTLRTICTHQSILSNNICILNTRKSEKQHYRWTETHMCTVLVNICAVVFFSIFSVASSCLVLLVWSVCDLNMWHFSCCLSIFFSITELLKCNWK